MEKRERKSPAKTFASKNRSAPSIPKNKERATAESRLLFHERTSSKCPG
jgi:hypothetical protein